ncbi:MAG: hypothetical protein KDC26_00430 [Armatimonadetes bacterium]|nr:hypothetical protein [Armatimonadota bacterium]
MSIEETKVEFSTEVPRASGEERTLLKRKLTYSVLGLVALIAISFFYPKAYSFLVMPYIVFVPALLIYTLLPKELFTLAISPNDVEICSGNCGILIPSQLIEGLSMNTSDEDIPYSIKFKDGTYYSLPFVAEAEEIKDAFASVANIPSLWGQAEHSGSVREPKAKDTDKQNRSW